MSPISTSRRARGVSSARRANAGRSDLLAEELVVLAVEDVADSEKDLQGAGGGHGDVIEGIRVEDVQIEIEDLDLLEARVLQHLVERVFREGILMIEIL